MPQNLRSAFFVKGPLKPSTTKFAFGFVADVGFVGAVLGAGLFAVLPKFIYCWPICNSAGLMPGFALIKSLNVEV